MEKKVTPTEIIDLIESLPDAEWHIHKHEGKQYVTQEWLCGPLTGYAFEYTIRVVIFAYLIFLEVINQIPYNCAHSSFFLFGNFSKGFKLLFR